MTNAFWALPLLVIGEVRVLLVLLMPVINGIAMAAPLFVIRSRKTASFFAVLLGLFGITPLCLPPLLLHNLRLGFYVWDTSFFLMAVGCSVIAGSGHVSSYFDREAMGPRPLGVLLQRAKVVFVGGVTEMQAGRVTIQVGRCLRGEIESDLFRFDFVDLARGKPEKGVRYFVFSQGPNPRREPEDVIQLYQGIGGQRSYCGWIMLPIRDIGDRDIVAGAFQHGGRRQTTPSELL